MRPVPGAPHDPRDATVEGAIARVDEAVAALEPYMHENVIPTGYVINPLLDVWSAASSLGPDVTRPIEELLRALVSRNTTNPRELVAALDELRIETLQASVLANA